MFLNSSVEKIHLQHFYVATYVIGTCGEGSNVADVQSEILFWFLPITALKAALNGGRSKIALGGIRAGVKWAGVELGRRNKGQQGSDGPDLKYAKNIDFMQFY